MSMRFGVVIIGGMSVLYFGVTCDDKDGAAIDPPEFSRL